MTPEQARGLVALVREGVEAGSTRVEEIQRKTLASVVSYIAIFPPLEAPAALVGAVVESGMAITHRTLRLATRGLASLAERVLAQRNGDDLG